MYQAKQNKKNKFISVLLLTVMLFATLASASVLPVFAAEVKSPVSLKMEDYYTAREDYIFDTPEKKWATMGEDYAVSQGNYEMRLDRYSGEVAVKDLRTGEIMFSNPYDVSTLEKTAANTRRQLLSQLIVTYINVSSGARGTMYSFNGAWYDTVNKAKATDLSVQRDYARQSMKVTSLKNGFMVEYTMGEEEMRTVVPYRITKERFETEIWNHLTVEQQAKFQLKGVTDPSHPDWVVGGIWYKSFDKYMNDNTGVSVDANIAHGGPVLELMNVTDNATISFVRDFEAMMKENSAIDYSYAQRQEDHEALGYGQKGKVNPLFKMAIEYHLGADGLSVSLPANSIRFDESNFQLVSVSLLPYFGAGDTTMDGYAFIPDGSGALVGFTGDNTSVYLDMYGNDFAYHDIKVASGNMQTARLPVFGMASTYKGVVGYESIYNEETGKTEQVKVEGTQNRGFVAIIEEGASMATISAIRGGISHKYCAAYTTFSPRPRDSYSLSESVASASASATWTVVSERKYTGNYKIRYTMLQDDALAAEANIAKNNYYACSYMGMALAYRNYLEQKGLISRMTEAKDTLPLYMETLGVIDTESTILSFPVTVKTPLTTFDDIKNMYMGYTKEDGTRVNGLTDAGITNVIVRLNGYTNGGVTGNIPYYVDFEKDLGDDVGFVDFLEWAQTKGIGVYPDFDFAYLHSDAWFDGFSYRNDAAKTIDNRYTQKQSYDPVFQCFTVTGLAVISPSQYNRFFEKFSEEMAQFYTEEMKNANIGVSVSTLGSDLNSDFDEDEPYNREDTRAFTETMLKNLKEQYKNVMIDGGNSFALPYASHVLNVSLESSRHIDESRVVPFFALVFHGYFNYAGSPTNMASSRDYESLRIVENGAIPYFILAFRNSSKLKDNPTLAKYYSISFDFWYDDMASIYGELNAALKDTQLSTITEHAFVQGERIRTAEELAYDAAVEATLTGDALTAYIEKATEQRTINDGTIVKVVYENGATFYLNYNVRFAVSVDGYEVPAISFIRVDKDASGMETVSVYRSETEYRYNTDDTAADATIAGKDYTVAANGSLKYEVLERAADGTTVVMLTTEAGVRTIYNYTTASYTFAETAQTVPAGGSATVTAV